MGYHTRYELEMTAPELSDYKFNEYYEEVKEDLIKEFDKKDLFSYVFDENFESYDEAKWYDHEEDMKEISKNFPLMLFALSGEGEDNDDVWHKYFLNGKMQVCRAKITFDKYDKNKLE